MNTGVVDVAIRLHPDRALPPDPTTRAVARELLAETAALPIVSMHGHVEAGMLSRNEPFADPTTLLVTPDHYLIRMLVSQGVPYGSLTTPQTEADARRIWRLLCIEWPAFRGTPTRYWIDHVLHEVFGWEGTLDEGSADRSYDHVAARLAEPAFRPQALFERFRIELLATTDAPHCALTEHASLQSTALADRVVPTFRPDALLEPLAPGWTTSLRRLARAADTDTDTYDGFLTALAQRRRVFVASGARATDHSHARADTSPLPDREARRLFARARARDLTPAQAAALTAHLLFQMAEMSAEDRLVMQIHHGILRDHDQLAARAFGSDIGLDIPTRIEFTKALRPVLEAFGRRPTFRMIAFTADETTYSRELAPLAGVYPALRLGAPWWFLDAPEAMRRFRLATLETAGFRNTSGFVDDTRAFCSIPARHDLSRRIDAGCLAALVVEHRLDLEEARDCAVELAYGLPHASYPSLLTSVS